MTRIPTTPTAWVGSLTFSRDGTRIAAGTGGNRYKDHSPGEALVWDTTTGELLVNLPQKPHAFQAAFTPDGSLLVTGGNTGIPSFWDTRTWKLVARPAQGHGSALIGMSVDPGGRIASSLPLERVLGCVVHLTCSCPEPGVVQHGWGDGRGGAIPDTIDPDVYLHLITRNGRETDGIRGDFGL